MATINMQNYDSNNEPPVWDIPPMDSYEQDSMPPQEIDNDIIYDLPEKFSQSNSAITYLDGDLELYLYPRIIKKYDKDIIFGDRINKSISNSNITSNQIPVLSNLGNNYSTNFKLNVTSNNLKQSELNNNTNADSGTPSSSYQNKATAEPVAVEKRTKPQSMSNNISFLDTTPLLIIMEHFSNYFSDRMKVKHLYKNVFDMGGFKIRVNSEENKWFNLDSNKGNTNALSLARELIAIHDDVNLNDREFFRQVASNSVKEVSKIQKNIEKYTNLDELVKFTLNEDKDKSTKKISDPKTESPKTESPKNEINWKAMREHIDSTSMRSIAEWLGASPNEDGNDSLWKFHTTGHNISINGQRWKNWNSGNKGGVGAISFMKQYISITENIDESEDVLLYKKAFNILMKEFGEVSGDFNISGPDYQTSFCFPHILSGKTNSVKDYLNEKRGLPLWLINKQISNGVLFAGFPSDWPAHKLIRESAKMPDDFVWATFLSPNGMAAEMRGIANNYKTKILAKGSEKSSGGYLVPAEDENNEGIIAICEAAIDSMSYSALYPGRSSTSVMGVNVNLSIELTFEANEKGLKCHINYDNDFPGNQATIQYHKAMINEVEDESSYKEYLDSGKIKLFELGIQVLKESLKCGIPYFFDMHSKEDGIEAADLFLQSILRELPRDEVKDHLIRGRLKLNNVCPNWYEIKDFDLEAKTAVEFIRTKPRFYYYAEPVKDLEEQIYEKDPEKIKKRQQLHDEVVLTRENFIKSFEKYAGPENLILWKKDRRITDSIEPLAKDWNDWMKYQLVNDLNLSKQFQAREQELKHYEKSAHLMKKNDLGNPEKLKIKKFLK